MSPVAPWKPFSARRAPSRSASRVCDPRLHHLARHPGGVVGGGLEDGRGLARVLLLERLDEPLRLRPRRAGEEAVHEDGAADVPPGAARRHVEERRVVPAVRAEELHRARGRGGRWSCGCFATSSGRQVWVTTSSTASAGAMSRTFFAKSGMKIASKSVMGGELLARLLERLAAPERVLLLLRDLALLLLPVGPLVEVELADHVLHERREGGPVGGVGLGAADLAAARLHLVPERVRELDAVGDGREHDGEALHAAPAHGEVGERLRLGVRGEHVLEDVGPGLGDPLLLRERDERELQLLGGRPRRAPPRRS